LALLLAGCRGSGGGGTSPGTSGGRGTGGGDGTLNLSRVAPTTNGDGTALADLAGYKIYYGTASGVYGNPADAGNVPTFTLTGLTKGQIYYVAATAYDPSNNESTYWNEGNGAAP
jgi:hypothetical protein